MAPQAWIVGEKGEDLQGSKEFVPLSKLEDIGVLYWKLDPKKSESEEELAKIRKERGYSYMDLIEICPDKLENYEEKVKNFFTEHMHADEEIRYCLEGSGYFDVRDKDDKWIRIWIKEGDMIILPAGIYHLQLCEAHEALHWGTSLDSAEPASGGPPREARVRQECGGEHWIRSRSTLNLSSPFSDIQIHNFLSSSCTSRHI